MTRNKELTIDGLMPSAKKAMIVPGIEDVVTFCRQLHGMADT